MALSKTDRAALEAWKKGEGEFPESLDKGLFFENDDHLNRVVNQKLGPATKAERAKLQAEMLDALGITDPEELKDVKHKLAEAAGTVTEVEKLRADKVKFEKELKKRDDTIAALTGFQVKVLKAQALDPHLTKVAEPYRAVVRKAIEGDLKIDGEKVTAGEGLEVEAYVESFLKANPAFKVPETKAGAGTGPSGGKSKGNEGGASNGGSNGSNGGQPNGAGNNPKFPTSFGAALVAVMKENDGGGSAQ